MGKYLDSIGLANLIGKIKTALGLKQDTLVSGTNIKTVNNQSLLGSGNIAIGGSKTTWYGTCSTDANSYDKTVECNNFTAADLVEGAVICVEFTKGNTAGNAQVPYIRLNINNTGFHNAYGDRELSNALTVDTCAAFVYDGSEWRLANDMRATTSKVGKVMLSSAIDSTSDLLAATPHAVKKAYDLANGKQDALVSGTNIKTINGNSILGSGDLTISGGSGGSKTTWYGTCSTTAGTAAKAVTCSGFTLEAGAIIGVLFSTANTAATPTLNVNSTGAKSIYVGTSTPNSTTNVLKWSANTMVYFMYDGTYYRYITSKAAASVVPPDGAGSWYGTCSTAIGTAAKTSTITNFRLMQGARVTLNCTTANTVVGAITLNINSTGAKTIYYNNAATSSSNPLKWEAGDMLTFVYSGNYWYFVGRAKSSEGGSTPTWESTDVTNLFYDYCDALGDGDYVTNQALCDGHHIWLTITANMEGSPQLTQINVVVPDPDSDHDYTPLVTPMVVAAVGASQQVVTVGIDSSSDALRIVLYSDVGFMGASLYTLMWPIAR